MTGAPEHRTRFLEAAAQLRAGARPRLVQQLWGEGPDPANQADLLELAALCRDVFALRLPHAPGGAAFGAVLAPEDVQIAGAPAGSNGRGLTLGAAFESCMGEVAEHLALLEHPDDPLIQSDPPGAVAWAGWTAEVTGGDGGAGGIGAGWVAATPLAGGDPVAFPAELVLRRQGARYQASSAGLGAGPSFDAALWSALLECVERDALALWWRGGAPGRSVSPPQAEALARRIRDGTRPCWFLDITSDLGIPVVVALSSAEGGAGIAAGASAALDYEQAAAGALLELCQMELSRALSLARAGRAESQSLNPVDAAWLLKEQALSLDKVPRLLGERAGVPGARPVLKKDQALQKIHECGVTPYGVPLTRGPSKVPVVRVILAGAQPGLSGPATARLRHCAEKNGQALALAAESIAPL